MDVMEKIFNVIAIILMSLVGLILLFSLFRSLSPRKRVEIIVVSKRKTAYETYGRIKQGVSYHYTIDCRYQGSDKIHTLSCTEGMYGMFREDRNYPVIIKGGSIIMADGYSYDFPEE